MKIHELKTHPEPFSAVCMGLKAFEYRKNDRGFRVGDVLLLKEWSPAMRDYTGLTIKGVR